MYATARAHGNLALAKYWGKRDEERILPFHNSLSVTLDELYTTTTVRFDSSLQSDTFTLDDRAGSDEEQRKVSAFLDLVRDLAGVEVSATVDSTNHVPTSQGLASSASGFAALAAAATAALHLRLSARDLSRLARRGSGSACRSIYGGFVEWQSGEQADGQDSYAIQIANQAHWDIVFLVCVVSSSQKAVHSRDGMRRTLQTSPFYAGWLATVGKDIDEVRQAINGRNFEELGRVAEANALKMHGTTLGANPPFCYWNEASITVMNCVRDIRAAGVPAYFTMDAGPNVVALCQASHAPMIHRELANLACVHTVIACRPGPGVTILEEVD